MSVLSGKKILLGVSGGIAAYKTASLVRLFIKAGAEVRVIMTPAAADFVTPLTLSALSKHRVYLSFTEEDDPGMEWNNHVELGLWADYMLIAPATANTMAKMTSGAADNFLMAVYLSAKCPVYVAPAMDLDMYKHGSTTESLEALKRFGNIIIPAESGELASGLHGEGRMAEPENILFFMESHIASGLPLLGKKILVTAGPTYEAIDPVRFIGNHSSGKMGYDIAGIAATSGASVVLVSGPTHLSKPHPSVEIIRVTSAREMFEVCHEHFADADAFIAAAAVADYRPKFPADQKIKKNESEFVIELEKTQDILASLGAEKKQQMLIGFALETENEIANAEAKIRKKNLDLIVLNSLRDEGAGFGHDTNKVTFIDSAFQREEHQLKSKTDVARDIIQKVIENYA